MKSNVRVLGTGSYAPQTIVTNLEIEAKVSGVKADWTERVLGIRERRIASQYETTADLATEAAKRALEGAELQPAEIDLILVATSTPDRIAPSVASEVQAQLGCRCAAMDVQAVCSGFIYAFAIGAHFVSRDIRHVLIIGVDTFSKLTDWNSRDCVFFGDGAGAVILGENFWPGVLAIDLGADGQGGNGFCVERDATWHMDGPAVYRMALEHMTNSVMQALEQADLTIWNVDHVIPHQPSVTLLRAIAERLGIDFTKFHTNMDRYANTAAASIPLLFDEVNRAGLLRTGDIVVLVAAGAGWTWGTVVLRW